MSIEMDSPKTLLERVDAVSNLVEQMHLSFNLRDNEQFNRAYSKAHGLLPGVIEELDIENTPAGDITSAPEIIPTVDDHIKEIAGICHELNRTFCQATGDDSQPNWTDAPEWQRASAIDGVRNILDGVVNAPEDSHVSWMKQKEVDGWIYGPVKDPEKKEHPCMVPFEELPREQQYKDVLFYYTTLNLLKQYYLLPKDPVSPPEEVPSDAEPITLIGDLPPE